MKYLLDTNICIFLLNHVSEVMAAFAEHRSAGIAISFIVLAELEFGICNSRQKEHNRMQLLRFLSTVEVLAFESAAAVEYGEIRERCKAAANQSARWTCSSPPTPRQKD